MSKDNLWESSSSFPTALYSSDVYPEERRRVDSHPEGRRAMELEPGAPLFDASARLFSSGRVVTSMSTLSGVTASPRQRYHTTNELGTEPVPFPVYARRRAGSGSPPKCKVKRVPVPQIPMELLEEHERQICLKRAEAGVKTEPARRMYELVEPDADGNGDGGPPPGLMMYDNREGRAGRNRLLDNARAWFRRI